MPRKPIITAAIAASLATSANADLRPSDEFDDGDIVAAETVADTILIHDASDSELGDLIGGWEPPESLTNHTDYDIDYLAQTVYAGPGDDGVSNRLRQGGKDLKIQKPGKGITLDNGIKKPGKLRLEGQGQQGKKLKKLKK